MNRGIKVLQTSALPLGYVAIKGESNSPEKLAIRNGLEPSTSSVTGWHSNQLNYRTAMFVVGATGLEPVTPCL